MCLSWFWRCFSVEVVKYIVEVVNLGKSHKIALYSMNKVESQQRKCNYYPLLCDSNDANIRLICENNQRLCIYFGAGYGCHAWNYARACVCAVYLACLNICCLYARYTTHITTHITTHYQMLLIGVHSSLVPHAQTMRDMSV